MRLILTDDSLRSMKATFLSRVIREQSAGKSVCIITESGFKYPQLHEFLTIKIFLTNEPIRQRMIFIDGYPFKELKMKMQEVREKAKVLELKNTFGLSKAELIRRIQKAEGNFDCFGTAKDYCDQLDCCFRDDCLRSVKD
jgi:hypothetical protein